MTNSLEPIDDLVTVPLRVVVHAGELHARVVPETLRPGALDRPVRWASVCELLDPAPYLLGEELMLTSGMNLPDDRAEVDAYVRRLQAAGVTALGFGITPPFSLELPDSLRLACARHGLPLLVVPASVPFLAVARVVAVALGEVSQREARRVASAREALTRAATQGLDELVADLANRLSGWVCLLGEGHPAGAEPLAGHRAPAPLPVRSASWSAGCAGAAGCGGRAPSWPTAPSWWCSRYIRRPPRRCCWWPGGRAGSAAPTGRSSRWARRCSG
ncbi:hypothetical protein GCM10023321_62770 [Pseudonocardia eucalypti]|uniref:Purine catabolism PurC-like domain-containing protein n=1 Tax=Pseudonocardia eucalypti TaxID=648755 RepID=A0ABP9QWR9_9PSEU|nr:hypothetical protein [Pseudonocardia eucalypti]